MQQSTHVRLFSTACFVICVPAPPSTSHSSTSHPSTSHTATSHAPASIAHPSTSHPSTSQLTHLHAPHTPSTSRPSTSHPCTSHPSTARGPPPLPNPPCTCMCRDSWASARPYSRQQLGCSAGAAVETGENSDPCSICFEQVGTNGEADTLTCGHIFCRDCIGRWRTGNGRARDRGRSGGPRADCPNCRAWGGVLVDLS